MKYKMPLVLILLLVSIKSISQTTYRDVTIINDRLPHSARGQVQDIEGTPYLNDSYTEININEKQFRGKYNACFEYFEIEENNLIKYALPENNIHSKIEVGEDKVKYKAVKINSKTYAFLKVLSEINKTLILERAKIDLIPSKSAKDSFGKSSKAHFKRKKDSFYIFNTEKEKLTQIPKSKRQFIKAFPKNKEKIKNYIKQNKINLKSKEDLIKLFNYYYNL